MKIYYNQKLKSLSRELRKNSTLSEVLLWNHLKARKMMGYQFMRQKPIADYIVDFYCSKLKLAIEIDGRSHNGKFEEDITRQQKIESLDIAILRFDDVEVKRDIWNVIRAIEKWIEEYEITNNPLSPFVKGE